MAEKSRPKHQSKKPGKTLKQKRLEKRAHETKAPGASILPPHALHSPHP